MALTEFQKNILKLLSGLRIENGESYIAGGTALNTLIQAPRISRDIDLFHDTREALAASWDADRKLLENSRYTIQIVRERPLFVEAIVSRDTQSVLLQWTCDSAFRFFPLVKHDELGLTLHPFDLATNKVLALVGRLEIRDWIDVIRCNDSIQRIGYVLWAACGKDPGMTPLLILSEAKRSSHYTHAELNELSFEGPTPDIKKLSEQWRAMLQEAENIIDCLPYEQVGACILDDQANLFNGTPAEFHIALNNNTLHFHSGRIKGALPSIVR